LVESDYVDSRRWRIAFLFLPKPLQKLSQHLLWAGAVIAVPFFPKKGTKLGFGDDEVGAFKHGVHVIVSEFKSDAKLFYNLIIGERIERFGNYSVRARTSSLHDQSIEKTAEH
jgi:hypothetical protein